MWHKWNIWIFGSFNLIYRCCTCVCKSSAIMVYFKPYFSSQSTGFHLVSFQKMKWKEMKKTDNRRNKSFQKNQKMKIKEIKKVRNKTKVKKLGKQKNIKKKNKNKINYKMKLKKIYIHHTSLFSYVKISKNNYIFISDNYFIMRKDHFFKKRLQIIRMK